MNGKYPTYVYYVQTVIAIVRETILNKWIEGLWLVGWYSN